MDRVEADTNVFVLRDLTAGYLCIEYPARPSRRHGLWNLCPPANSTLVPHSRTHRPFRDDGLVSRNKRPRSLACLCEEDRLSGQLEQVDFLIKLGQFKTTVIGTWVLR